MFAYRTFGSDLSQSFGHDFEHLQIDNWGDEMHRSGRLKVRTLFNFLGIHWAQFPEEWEINAKKRPTKKQARKTNTKIKPGNQERRRSQKRLRRNNCAAAWKNGIGSWAKS